MTDSKKIKDDRKIAALAVRIREITGGRTSLVCVGPPDTIVQGSSTVMICGRPAARMGDNTAHGGSIAIGCPTVLIGD